MTDWYPEGEEPVVPNPAKERRHYYIRTRRYPAKGTPKHLIKRAYPDYGHYGFQIWRTRDTIAIDIWIHKRLYVISLCWHY
jgi:hypothetical protein